MSCARFIYMFYQRTNNTLQWQPFDDNSKLSGTLFCLTFDLTLFFGTKIDGICHSHTILQLDLFVLFRSVMQAPRFAN